VGSIWCGFLGGELAARLNKALCGAAEGMGGQRCFAFFIDSDFNEIGEKIEITTAGRKRTLGCHAGMVP